MLGIVIPKLFINSGESVGFKGIFFFCVGVTNVVLKGFSRRGYQCGV